MQDQSKRDGWAEDLLLGKDVSRRSPLSWDCRDLEGWAGLEAGLGVGPEPELLAALCQCSSRTLGSQSDQVALEDPESWDGKMACQARAQSSKQKPNWEQWDETGSTRIQSISLKHEPGAGDWHGWIWRVLDWTPGCRAGTWCSELALGASEGSAQCWTGIEALLCWVVI